MEVDQQLHGVIVIMPQDVWDAGYCPSGTRRWFEAYGFDFRDFLKNGIDETVFLATNDACAIRVVEMKRARDHG